MARSRLVSVALPLTAVAVLVGCTPRVGLPACPPGPPAPGLDEDTPEGRADAFDDDVDVDAVDAARGPLPLDDVDDFTRDLVAWMLDVPRDDLGALDLVDVRAMGPFGFAVTAAVDDGRIDEERLRAGLQRYHACARPAPATLAEFEHDVLDLSASTPELVDSVPKGRPRHIWRDAPAGAFVAQTRVDGAVRETEVLLSDRRRDGALDVVVYGADGGRAGASTFVDEDGVAFSGGVPFACFSCHHGPRGFVELSP